MANIKIESVCPLYDGMPVTFKAPCDCTETTGLKVCYGTTEQTFIFRDAHGSTLTGIGNLFAEGVYVKAILDTTSGYAYLQNADTNKYLEDRIGGGQVSALNFSNWESGTFSVELSDGTTQEGTVVFDDSSRPTSITLNGNTLAITYPGESSSDSGTTETITFTIASSGSDGTPSSAEYTADSGMTWAEWCESSYNSDMGVQILAINDNGYVISAISGLGFVSPQLGTDVIVAGETYTLESAGSDMG